MEEKIFDRLLAVLEDRKPNAWVKEIGIDRSAIRIIKEKDSLPGPDTLITIRRAEGVNLVWFMEGCGDRFSVVRFQDDEERATSLKEHLGDENWTVTIATDWNRHAAVLSQPLERQLPDQVTVYRYTIIEVFPGLQKKSLDAIAEHAKDIRLAELSQEQMDAVFTGRAGTYRLLNANDAWLRNARPIGPQHVIFSEAHAVPRILTHDEEHLIKLYGQMAAEQRATYKAIGNTLAQQTDKAKSGESAD